MPEFTARVVAEEGPPPEPHTIQQEALAALAQSRSNGHRAGLVVLATGLGKTWRPPETPLNLRFGDCSAGSWSFGAAFGLIFSESGVAMGLSCRSGRHADRLRLSSQHQRFML
jgi:hypothetical protein